MAPDRVFAFLDVDHTPTAWAVMRGSLVSSEHVDPQFTPGFVSQMLAGMVHAENTTRLSREFLIERVRIERFPAQASRLKGMFFFRSREDALARIGDREWPPYFSEENLAELELVGDRPPTIVDADWITFGAGRVQRWIDAYWAGEPRSHQPVWELISDGVAVVLDEAIRRRCFHKVAAAFPKCRIPILMARLAGEAGSRGGLVAPQLVDAGDRVRLRYLWSDQDFKDPDVVAAMRAHPDFPALGGLVAAARGSWSMPDFGPWHADVPRSVLGGP